MYLLNLLSFGIHFYLSSGLFYDTDIHCQVLQFLQNLGVYCISKRFCVLQTGPDGEKALRTGKTLDLELGGFLAFELTTRGILDKSLPAVSLSLLICKMRSVTDV